MSIIGNPLMAGGGAYASISISGLLSTDSVTATLGSKTKHGVWDSATSKFIINNISDLGTWTVTAISGERSQSISVLVDTITAYNITWIWHVYLYNLGDECESITGGWKAQYNTNGASSGGYMIKESDYIKFHSGSGGVSSYGIMPNNSIDCTNYTSLKFKLKSITGEGCVIGYLIDGTVPYPDNLQGKAYYTPSSPVDGVITYDLSNISGAKYLTIQAKSNTGYVEVSKAWLE